MVVRAIIEIPQGSQNKYEMDVKTGAVRLDRVLYGSMHYPANYGFVPDTWGTDNDPLDIVVYGSTAIHPGVDVPVRVVGALMMQDEHGLDAKLIGVIDVDPRMDGISILEDLGPHRLKELRHFFQEYKTLQGLSVTLGNYQDVVMAERLWRESVDRWHARQEGERPDA